MTDHRPKETIAAPVALLAALGGWLAGALAAAALVAVVLRLAATPAQASLLDAVVELPRLALSSTVFAAAALFLVVGAWTTNAILCRYSGFFLCAGCALMSVAVALAVALAVLLFVATFAPAALGLTALALLPVCLLVSATDVWSRALPQGVDRALLEQPLRPDPERGEGFVRYDFAALQPASLREQLSRVRTLLR